MASFEEQDRQDNEKHADGIVEDRKQSPPPYFTVLFYGLILWGVAFSAYYLLSGWSSEGEFEQNMASHQERFTQQPAATESAPAAAAVEVDAAAIYAEKCAVCHADDGSGGIGSALTGDYKFGKSEQEVRVSIADGRPGGMPGFGNQLSAAEIDALTVYLINL
jgi:cytochrome c oxidase cbb3-type subunit 3